MAYFSVHRATTLLYVREWVMETEDRGPMTEEQWLVTEDRGPATENPSSGHPNTTRRTLTVNHNEAVEAPDTPIRLHMGIRSKN